MPDSLEMMDRQIAPEEARLMWDADLWDDARFIVWMVHRSECTRDHAEKITSYLRGERERSASRREQNSEEGR